jgi:glycosyltransferase involved in cell wall biosynthesis
MRILIINSEYPPVGGGAGNASANLAKALSALHQEVTVLTVRFGDLPFYSKEDGILIRRIKSIRRNKDRSGAFEQGIFILTGSIGLLSLAQEWKPDIILAFFGIPAGAVTWLTRWFTQIPYLVSLRGGDVPGFRPYDFAVYHRLIGPILHRIWKRAELVVANSQGLAALARDFDQRVNIEVIPNGVDILQYQMPPDRDWENPHMLWVGRLVYQKGLDILVESLGELKSLPWKLTLIGDGPQRAALQRLAIERGIDDRLEFTGWLDRAALMKYYYASNLFVFPSRHEGMPNAILEAMASGLPVIASRIAGNEELVLPEKTGFLVPPQDAGGLREALETLLVDPERRKQMGLASRQRVEANYTWEQVAREYLTLLQDMLR